MEDILVNKRDMSGRDWAIDVAVACGAFAVACVQLMLTVSSIIVPDLALRQYLGMVNLAPEASAFVALAVTTLPLVLRRVVPWPVLGFVMLAYFWMQTTFTSYALPSTGLLVALFTVAVERRTSEAVVAALVAMAGSILFPGSSSTPTLGFFVQIQNVGLIAAAATAGYAVQVHRAYVKAAEQRAAEAERSREEEAARRVEEERVRIAREVHDITAHSLSAVSIQTAAAERLIDRDPAAAKEAVAAARATAKSALEDIRSMIGVLRQGDASAETAPAAGTDRLSDIASYMESAGTHCRVDNVSYSREQVPAHVDLALYAIAREAATNIVRHAHATQVTFTLESVAAEGGGGTACLTVVDNGRGSGVPLGSDQLPAAIDGVGHGLTGMAERARLLGGALEAGDQPGGGFCVRVALPFVSTEAPASAPPAASGRTSADAAHAESPATQQDDATGGFAATRSTPRSR